MMNQLVPVIASRTPALVAASGARAAYRFLEFFTAQIRNPHTRRAYARAATEFFDWLETKGVTQITAIESVHVATYIEQLQRARSAPTAKLRLAALRHLFDWMVIGQIMPTNPVDPRDMPVALGRRCCGSWSRHGPLAWRNDETGARVSGENGVENSAPIIGAIGHKVRVRQAPPCELTGLA